MYNCSFLVRLKKITHTHTYMLLRKTCNNFSLLLILLIKFQSTENLSRLLVSAYNSDNIEIITEQNSINLIKGNDSITAEKSRHKNIAFYVDSENYSSEKQDGTETYPFSSLNQCLGNISRNNAITYTIHLADGDYNKEFVSYDEDKDISSLYGVTNTVIIQGNESDRTAVVLHHGFNIRNCSNIEIKNLTILNGGTKYGFDIHNSNVKISNVNYSIDTERTESRNIAISSSYSNLYIQNSLIDNAVHGIKASYCKLVIDSLQMTNLTYQALNLLKCIVQADSCSVTDSSVNLVTNQDNNFKSSFLNGISLWSGSKAFDSVTAENNTFSMNSRIDKFREIKIKYITDSNKYKSVIVPVTSNSMNTSIISSNIDSSNYLYNQQLSVSFSGTNVTISSGYRYKQNMTDPTITPIASNSNITKTEILGL